ncbi:MAG TPA: nucleotidyltransferase domain-containing protein [Stellaceae bacterium]|nr:nucleotidyltransferase domain-containing protein [Stellaceae bacterium]
MAAEKAAVPREAKSGDPVVRAALGELDRKLRARFGDRYVGLILFGSRARGDNAPDSDADVAVVLRGRIADRWSVERQIIGETYPILLDTGLYIESWPLEQSELDDPDRSSNPALLRNVLREGIRV